LIEVDRLGSGLWAIDSLKKTFHALWFG